MWTVTLLLESYLATSLSTVLLPLIPLCPGLHRTIILFLLRYFLQTFSVLQWEGLGECICFQDHHLAVSDYSVHVWGYFNGALFTALLLLCQRKITKFFLNFCAALVLCYLLYVQLVPLPVVIKCKLCHVGGHKKLTVFIQILMSAWRLYNDNPNNLVSVRYV